MRRPTSKGEKPKRPEVWIVHLPSTRSGFAVCGEAGDSLRPGHSIAADAPPLDRCLTCYELKSRGTT